MKKLFLALCVCASFCACSDDAIDGTDSSSSISLDGNDVYLTVRLNDVNSATRASGTTSSGWSAGQFSENEVTSAYFYFYDENGDFVSRADVWDITGDTPSTPGSNVNVELKSNTIVVLKGLTDTKFPRYMVTILNEEDVSDFESDGAYEPAATLDEFQSKLASQTYTGIYDGGTSGNFVMSTSAYATPVYTPETGDPIVSPWYFVTPINESNFTLEPITSGIAEPVDVYVERLAAKVEVGVAMSNQTAESILTGYIDENGDVVANTGNDAYVSAYVLDESIAGEANDPYTGTVELEGVDKIYIEFLGWALNGTARYSNIVKDITPFVEDGVAQEVGGWAGSGNLAWNDEGDYRSYWGASFNYGIGSYNTYPTSNVNPITGEPNTDVDEGLDTETSWLNPYLKYTSLVEGNIHDLSLDNTDPEYCAENTNTADILLNKRSSGITNALVKARGWTKIGESEDGDDVYGEVTLIRFEGMLFTEAAFTEYIANRELVDMNNEYEVEITNWTSGLFGQTSSSETVEGTLADFYWSSTSITAGNEANYVDADGHTLSELQNGWGTGGNRVTGLTGLTLNSVIDSSQFGFTNVGDGNVEITYNMEEIPDNATVWFCVGVNADGEKLYTLVHDDATGGTLTGQTITTYVIQEIKDDIIADLAELNEEYEMNAYLNGLMYYSIPIEHLNTVEPTLTGNETADDVIINEANYGIVRNHWYQLSINSISSVGKGIANEDEVIVPDPSEPISYYIEAQINILSWRMVEQGVNL